MAKLRIDFMYSKATGISDKAKEALEQAIEAVNADVEVIYSEINDSEEAKVRRFLGSPSIRINGMDIEYGEREPEEYTAGGRYYNTFEGWKPYPHAKMIANMMLEQMARAEKK